MQYIAQRAIDTLGDIDGRYIKESYWYTVLYQMGKGVLLGRKAPLCGQ